MSEVYDEQYNIFQHNDRSNPLSSVACHYSEDFNEFSLGYRKLKEFANLKIGSVFNISFIEYISLPMYIHEDMCKIALDIMKTSSNVVSEFKKELEGN